MRSSRDCGSCPWKSSNTESRKSAPCHALKLPTKPSTNLFPFCKSLGGWMLAGSSANQLASTASGRTRIRNSRHTTAYKYADVVAHTHAAMLFHHPYSRIPSLVGALLGNDAPGSFGNIFHFRPSTSVATAGARAVVRSAGLHELWRSRADRWSALDRLCAAQ